MGDLVLILSGDHLYRMDYRKFAESHLASGAELSIAVTPVTAAQVPDFGVMKVNGRGRITEFTEKPKDPADIERMRVPEEVLRRAGVPADRTHLASMGVYIFSRSVLKDLLAHTDSKDFGKEVIPRAIQDRKVFSHFFNGYWEDIGTIPSFFEAHMDLTRPLPKFNFYDERKPIFTHARFLPGSKILASEVEERHPLRGQHRRPFPGPGVHHRDPVADRGELPDRADRGHGGRSLRIPRRSSCGEP